MSDSENEPVRIFEGIKFFLDGGFTIGQLQTLTEKIGQHGGAVLRNEEDEGSADTVLVRYDSNDRPKLVDRYSHSKKTWVEGPEFVERCIKRGRYDHDPILFKRMGGREAGSAPRVNFTATEDTLLAQYIADRIPEKHFGGRTGFKLYRELCGDFLEGGPRYPWAGTHPWQSWRERYRKNQARFDAMIDAIKQVRPPDPNGKGQFPSRRHGLHDYAEEDDEEEAEAEEDEEQDEGAEEEIDISGDERASTSRPRARRANLPLRRKRPRINSDNDTPPGRARQRQRRERTAEAQIAGPSGTQRAEERPESVELEGGVDLNDAPFMMELDGGGFEPDIQLPTQATLVEPRSTGKGKSVENPSRGPRVPSNTQDQGFKEPLPVDRPSVDTQATVVSSQPQHQTPAPQTPSASLQVPATPKRRPETLPLSQSSPRLARSARKIPSSSIWPPAAREWRDSDDASNEASPGPDIPLGKGRRQTAQRQKSKRRIISDSQQVAGASDAPYRNTRGRSDSADPAPMPLPPRRTRKGPGRGRAASQVPMFAQKIVEEESEELGSVKEESVENAVNANEADDVANTTIRSATSQGNGSVELDEVERALIEAENEEEEADSQAESDSEDDDDDSVFEAAQAGAKALLSGRPISNTQPRNKTPAESSNYSEDREVEDTIIIESGRKPKKTKVKEEIPLGLRDYASLTDDAFPTPGTRARQEAERIKESRKRGKYNPPRGTKAEAEVRTRSRALRS